MDKRIRIPFNHEWFFKDNFSNKDLTEFIEGKYQLVELPHTNHQIPNSYFLASDYQKVCLYTKSLQIEKLTDDQTVMIHFDGVMSFCDVYVDQTLIGSHYGGYTAFSFDITEYVRDHKTHRLAVMVDSSERTDFPPYGFVVDYLTYGGIYREVTIEIKPKTCIHQPFLMTKSLSEETWKLDVLFQIQNQLDDQYDVQFKAICLDHQIEYQTNVFGLDDMHLLTIDSTPYLWSLEKPNLYQYQLQIYQNNQLIDEITGSFGFRSIRADEKGFYLNNKLIKLVGLNRHQSYPYVGYAMPQRVQEQDAYILKQELGVNIVRTAHYPPSKHFLNMCDRLGLMVFEELPGWQHIGNDEWKQHALNQLHEMIIQDRNHPSIVIWGVRINESKDDFSFYQATNELAKSLDPTRPTGGVRNFKNSELLEDIYTYNDFIHRGKNVALMRKKDVVRKNVPYMVTEHNGHMFPTKKYDDEPHRIEQALRHLRVLNEMYGTKDILGAIGWCMNDYHTHHDFGSGDLVCHHGVMDMFRIPKFASYAYVSQGSKTPILKVLSSLTIGEYPASNPTPIYVMTNCEYIEIYKSGNKIGRYFPNTKSFPHLPHPPIIVDDLIGDTIEQNERFSKKDAHRIKKILNAFRNFGFQMPLSYKLMMGFLMAKYKLDMEQATILFGTYLGDWGNPSATYEFKGFIDEKVVCSVTKTQEHNAKLCITVDHNELHIGDTFDATRVVVRCVDQYDNDLVYINEPIQVSVSGSIELIGPNVVPLIGGSIAFWVKTKNQVGSGIIEIQSNQFGLHSIHIEVK
ncbi:MAG TPA: glycoside hydrolase family 2 TIM barrel-domain containing protein [Bacilli bacterium]|nr:glycoside hydrolase family 2 TIM barrel-domain containing protein [Bacilli bacterium]